MNRLKSGFRFCRLLPKHASPPVACVTATARNTKDQICEGLGSTQRRLSAFELWCWRRLLRVPWTARRSNQSILREISHEHSLEGLMLKLKLQYFGHLMQRTDTFEKTLMLGKTEGRRRRGRQRMRWSGSITNSMDTNLSQLRETVEDRGAWRAAVHGVTKSWTRLSDQTATTNVLPFSLRPYRAGTHRLLYM